MQLRSEARQEPEPLADMVLWSHLVAAPDPTLDGKATGPTVIQNKDGALMATLCYRGPDVTMLAHEEWCYYLEGWNRLIRRLGSGWAVWADEWHEPAQDYPQSVWTTPAGYFLDSIRKTVFVNGQLFETEQFLTVTWLPPSSRKQFLFDRLFVSGTRRKAQREEAYQLEQFQGAMQTFADTLSHLLPQCEWMTPKGTLTYLHRCVSWDRHQVALPERPEDLDRKLARAAFDPAFTPVLDGKYLRPITVQSWPMTVGLTIPSTLQQLAIPYRYCMRYLCLDAAKAKSLLHGMRRRWEVQVLPVMTHVADAWNGTKTRWDDPDAEVNEEARDNVYALQRAISAIASEDIAYGYGAPVILLWGATERQLAERERVVLKALQNDELVLYPERQGATDAWASMLPGEAYRNVQNPPLSTRVFAFLLPHGAYWTGELWDHQWKGAPLFTASSNGQPFRYVLHQGEVGNTMILGPTRTGKSAVLALMGMQALRYQDIQIYAFDRDFSLYCATLMAGGTHYNIGGQGQLGFQPFAHLHRGEAELLAKQEWVQDLCTAEGVPPTPDERQAIWDALVHLASQPVRERRISLFRQFLQVHRLKAVLEPYCTGGRFACFDAAEDSFQLGSQWTTFEMGAMLDLPPHVVALALQYMFRELEQTFTGRPTLLLLDEGWQFFTHEVFWPKVALWLKSKAKQNVSIVMSSQEVTDARNTALWQALQGSVRSWIFLPNKRAMNEDVAAQYKACGLTTAQTQLLALAQEYRDYFYKSDTNVRLFQMALDPLQRWLVAASKPEEIAALRSLQAQTLSEPLQAAWLRLNGFDEAADVFNDLLTQQEGAT